MVETALDGLSSITDVDVTRSSVDGSGGFVYNVTFILPLGDVATQLTVDDTEMTGVNASGTIKQISDGNALDDNDQFILGFGNSNTTVLTNGMAASSLREALEAIGNMGDVEVSRVGPDSANGYRWYITFVTNQGNVPSVLRA